MVQSGEKWPQIFNFNALWWRPGTLYQKSDRAILSQLMSFTKLLYTVSHDNLRCSQENKKRYPIQASKLRTKIFVTQHEVIFQGPKKPSRSRPNEKLCMTKLYGSTSSTFLVPVRYLKKVPVKKYQVQVPENEELARKSIYRSNSP